MNTVEIMTSNTLRENNVETGGYNETHKITCLSSKEHLIETVQNIVSLNKKYGYGDLDDIVVIFEHNQFYDCDVNAIWHDLCKANPGYNIFVEVHP